MEATLSEQKAVTYKLVKTGFWDKTQKVIRISVMDKYATEDENEDEEHLRPKVKKFVNEIRIIEMDNKECRDSISLKQCKERRRRRRTEEDVGVGKMKKLRGVRQRPWGRWGAEIRDPLKRTRVWLGTYDTAQEAAMVYDKAAIRLRGLHAITNFINPHEYHQFDMHIDMDNVNCGYNYEYDYSGKELHHHLSSPTSVLRFQSMEEHCEEPCLQDSFFMFLNSLSLGLYSDFEIPPPIFLDETSVPHFISNDNFTDIIPFDLDDGFESCNWDIDSYFKT